MARILLVDDEPTLLALLRRYLERGGHAVALSETAEDALQTFQESGPFDLVVADLTLPGMNGEELIVKLRELTPGLPAILSSGYAHETHLAGARFLQKPFLPNALGDLVTELLGP